MTIENREPISQAQTLKIWDLPIRLFHWSMVVLIGIAWWTAESRSLQWHRATGYAIFTLVLFRVVWGFVGSSTARFVTFIRGPRALWQYAIALWRQPVSPPAVGHNPLGGWSVVLMLSALCGQVLLGLFAVDIDGIESGPLAGWVSFDTGRVVAEIHRLVFDGLLVLIALHVVAVLFYLLIRRSNLIVPMIIGSRRWHGATNLVLEFCSIKSALAVLLSCALLLAVALAVLSR